MSNAGRLTTKVSTKGQVILPKSIRQDRRWSPGTRLIVEDTPDGVLLKAAPCLLPPSRTMCMATCPRRGPQSS
jgi:AbrB family looped-hinge helix DNA binding protein